MSFAEALSLISKWLNTNQGVLSAGIFAVTLFLGSVTGIFKSLRRVPRFRISLIEGPTFACTFETDAKHGTFDIHRTAIALYLNIANVGSSPSSIHSVSVGYHWNLKPFSFLWLKYSLGWFWLHDQAIALDDFQVSIGERIKVYPFLIQRSSISFSSTETYLEVGRATCGVVYFEQSNSWGGCFPNPKKKTVRIKVMVKDVFDRRYKFTFNIPFVSLDEARKYNPSFGKTRAELRQQPLPFDSLDI